MGGLILSACAHAGVRARMCTAADACGCTLVHVHACTRRCVHTRFAGGQEHSCVRACTQVHVCACTHAFVHAHSLHEGRSTPVCVRAHTHAELRVCAHLCACMPTRPACPRILPEGRSTRVCARVRTDTRAPTPGHGVARLCKCLRTSVCARTCLLWACVGACVHTRVCLRAAPCSLPAPPGRRRAASLPRAPPGDG